jgi:predicted DNA-binding antitoxin AbrB/MazE fold protein
MSRIEAIYRHGVFEPLEPVDLREGQRVRLRIEPTDKEPLEAWLERVKRHQAELVEKHGCLPDSTPGIAEDRMR